MLSKIIKSGMSEKNYKVTIGKSPIESTVGEIGYLTEDSETYKLSKEWVLGVGCVPLI